MSQRKHCRSCGEPKESGRGRSLCSRCGGGLSRREYGRFHYNKNKEKCKKYTVQYRARYPKRRLLDMARHRAKKKGLAFNLVEADVLIPEFCPVLCIRLEIGDRRKDSSPTLDRIDNTRGYVCGNIVVVSWRANRLKSDASLKELQQLASFYDKLTKE